MKKIPTMQELKEESIALVKKRKAINSKYQKAKAAKEELLIVRANINAVCIGNNTLENMFITR